MEGVSFYSCKEWGQNGHYIFKIINKGSLVTDKTVAKAPPSPSPPHPRAPARLACACNADTRPRRLSRPIARPDGLDRVRARCVARRPHAIARPPERPIARRRYRARAAVGSSSDARARPLARAFDPLSAARTRDLRFARSCVAAALRGEMVARTFLNARDRSRWIEIQRRRGDVAWSSQDSCGRLGGWDGATWRYLGRPSSGSCRWCHGCRIDSIFVSFGCDRRSEFIRVVGFSI